MCVFSALLRHFREQTVVFLQTKAFRTFLLSVCVQLVVRQQKPCDSILFGLSLCLLKKQTNMCRRRVVRTSCDPEFVNPDNHMCTAHAEQNRVIPVVDCDACHRDFHDPQNSAICFIHTCDVCHVKITQREFPDLLYCQNAQCPLLKSNSLNLVCIVPCFFGDSLVEP